MRDSRRGEADQGKQRFDEPAAGRYRIIAEIGRGGMATVYRARDLRYDNDVAFKLLRRELGETVTARRFAREIRIASALEHPNILPVLDSGDLQGLPFYVMPLVEGPTLERHLLRERRLEIGLAVRLAGEVASALSYAHAQGVVHRDVKPSNILLSGSHAMVVDFGIARHLDIAASERLTDSGIALGTAYYMSPEQGRGDLVDGRCDVYSLGCVLYEMLGGTPPFRGSSPQAVIAQHATERVPSLRALRAEIPASLEAAVMKALAKWPDDRFRDPGELKAAIDRAAADYRLSWIQRLRARVFGES
jgi:eukaryotic-like serine/threonine-protein kinase